MNLSKSFAPEKPSADAQLSALIFAIVLIDGEGRIADVNQSAEDLLKTSAKRLTGQLASDVLKIHDARVLAHLNQAEEALVARDISLLVDEEEKRINLTISPILAHSGWRSITISDIGRNDLNDPAQDDLGNLGAPSILAHEIKNPLAAIRGAGQLAERKLAPEDKGLARMITAEVDRIARLIDRMQQLGSTIQDKPEACNLHEAIRSAIATVRAAGPDIEIKEEFDPSLPPVLANLDALEQVLINLISNARDACSDEESPYITVRTRFVSGLVLSAIKIGGSVKLPIEICISDNGKGVDPALRDHVFEPFVTSKKSGQGLGLALVRKLVRDMAGRIGYDRDDRAGLTNFRIHLPQAHGEVDA
ncbi:MAG TPA: PAS domain-containing sensor histidine kinase [Erythrobacter sp.]|nr:PAS domain-containing sensor histidine kinase [Erythrobacter sp.]